MGGWEHFVTLRVKNDSDDCEMKMRKKISISIAVVIAVGFLKQLLPFRNPVKGASVNDYPIHQLNRACGR